MQEVSEELTNLGEEEESSADELRLLVEANLKQSLHEGLDTIRIRIMLHGFIQYVQEEANSGLRIIMRTDVSHTQQRTSKTKRGNQYEPRHKFPERATWNKGLDRTDR
jgi:hypothetical protein